MTSGIENRLGIVSTLTFDTKVPHWHLAFL